MTGKATGRASAKCSDTHSMFSVGTVRTVDREKLRDKARQFQMKESLRLAMCARIQQQLKKSPKAAEELASEVLKVLQQRGLPPDVSNDALAVLVHELSTRRSEQLALAAAATKAAGPEDRSDDRVPLQNKASGRRLSGSKDLSSRSRGKSGEKQQKGPHSRGTSDSRISSGDAVTDEDVYLTQSQLQQMSTGFRLPPRVSPKKDKNNGIWEEIVKFSSVEEQLEAKRKQEAKLRQRAELAERLSAQVNQKQERSANERQASEMYHRENMQRLSELEDDERRNEQQRLEKAKQLIQIQNEQRLTKMKQHEREQQTKKAQEAKMAELLRKQKEDDQAKELARREREQERLRLVSLENQRQLEQKRQEKERERELEIRLAGDYIKTEDAKEAARKKQLEDMASNIKAKMKFFDDTSKAGTDAKARDEEQRVRRAQEEYAKQQGDAERKKKADAEASSRAQQEFLRQQMVEKKARDAAAKRDLNKQAELWTHERVDAERRERLALQQRAVRNTAQQEVLRQQMRDKERRLLEADQTALEVQLNASILDRIHKHTGSAQANGAVVVSETQHRSRELQEKEETFLQRRPSRSTAKL
ncbi:hypothetical protein PybrP1_002196 [[Pythium] brassicae (nom. inval.)]|nr:hypothetical protein PybrP1_002196 [[Pythium] brassicae (nom. inval.)]